MSSFKKIKDKIQPFMFGLMLGLLVGIGFFIFKLDNYFKELNLYKKLHKNIEIQSKENAVEIELGGSAKKKAKNYKESKKNIPSEVSDSLSGNLTPSEDRKESIKDSLKKDTLIVQNESEEIIVKKDELVFAKKIEIVNRNSINNNTKIIKDSLLQQVTGIKEELLLPSYYKVEFWKSPINYKGYKMGKNKIAIYGINPSDVISLYILENVIYMKALNNIYRLDYADDFKPFEKTTDEEIVNKLK